VPNSNYAFGGSPAGVLQRTQSEDRSHVQHEGFRVRDSERNRDVALEHGSGTSCTNAALPLFACHNELRSEIYGISETHIFSPSLINEARVGVNLIWLPEYTTTTGLDFWGKYGIHRSSVTSQCCRTRDIRP